MCMLVYLCVRSQQICIACMQKKDIIALLLIFVQQLAAMGLKKNMLVLMDTSNMS